jgi:hypothetical protein
MRPDSSDIQLPTGIQDGLPGNIAHLEITRKNLPNVIFLAR